jgi:hypothetical protein
MLIGASRRIAVGADELAPIGVVDPEIGDVLSFAREPETGLTYMLAGTFNGPASLNRIDPYTLEISLIGELPQEAEIAGIAGIPACPPDFNADGVLNVLDFVAFQLSWQAKAPNADCDWNGTIDVMDIACFQEMFATGCE